MILGGAVLTFAVIGLVHVLDPCQDYWNDYRLSDAVKQVSRHNHWKEDYKPKYPYSLAYEYLDSEPASVHVDIPLLATLARANQLPANDTLVVHLRMGDVIDDVGDVVEFWSGGQSTKYVFNRAYYDGLDYPAEIQRVVLVGSNVHHASDHDRSHQYLLLVQEWFRTKLGVNVTTEWHGGHHTPDDDFGYMTLASWFVVGGGGYSGLVAKCVLHNGGTVVSH